MRIHLLSLLWQQRLPGRAKHIRDKMKRDLYVKDLKLKLIEHLYSRNLTEEKNRALINFIRFYVVFEFKETQDIFDKELQILTNNTKTMGLEEQIKEMIKERAIKIGEKRGIVKGRVEERNELKEKFAQKLIQSLGYIDQQIAELVEVPLNFVEKLRKQKVIVV